MTRPDPNIAEPERGEPRRPDAGPLDQIKPTNNRPGAESRTADIDAKSPDAVAPEVRSDDGGPLHGGQDADSGAGAAGGRDRGGSPRIEPRERPEQPPGAGGGQGKGQG